MQVKLLDIELLEAAALTAQCHGQVTWSEGGFNHFKIGELWIIAYDDDDDDDDAMFWDMYIHITISILYVII